MTTDNKQQHHFFASCCLSWARAGTREEAIERCVRHAGTADVKRMTLNAQKGGQAGFYVFSIRVDVPDDKEHPYTTEYFAPRGVPVSEPIDHDVTYITAKELAYTSNKRGEES